LGGLGLETEKALIVVVIASIVTLGLVVGVTFLTFEDPYAGNHTTTTTAGTVAEDTDLLSSGIQLPDWNLVMSDGEIQTLHSFRGRFLVVDLMATWCSSCAVQNVDFEQLYADMSDTIWLISLSIDLTETASMLADYATNNNLDWPHGLDTNGVFGNYFQPEWIPSMVVIDDAGYLRWFHVGMWPIAEMTQTLNQLMA
jgi:hypothetical protein